MSLILVHQTLHGYSDGHRLISSSITLDAADARIMLVMSDLSGPGMKPPTDGYLTGYPLENSGKYVLARTWAAPEMSRPGCVWTHSLIIDNADLAKCVSAQGFLDAFSRPQGGDFRTSHGLEIALLLHKRPRGVERTLRVESLLHALYSFPQRQIVVEAEKPADDEQIATAIWMQQWPRLRRTFGFCTLSGMDRSGKGIALDLQFVPDQDRQLRSKFHSAVISNNASIRVELLPLLADLVEPAASTLREFLKRTGGDVDGGRRAMLPLCLLHSGLLERRSPDLTLAVSALATLDSDGRKQARSIRTLVAQQALKSAGTIDDSVFEFLLEMLEQSSDQAEQVEISDKIGVELWRRFPDRFYSALNSDGILQRVTLKALTELSSDQVLSVIQANAHLATDIAKRRPDILKLAAFWKIPEVEDELVDRIPDEDTGAAAQALLTAGRVGPAAAVISRADPTTLIRSLESNDSNLSAVKEWLSALCHNQNKLAAALASGQVKRMATLVAVARQTSPDDVPNVYGEDPWLTALRSASNTVSQSDGDFLAAYLLTRALGWGSRSQATLLQYTYSRVYKAFENGWFSPEAENLATSRLSQGSWFDWDNCSRLREAVTSKFVDFDLDPDCFVRLAEDGSLALSLIDEATRSKKGRAYLKRVHEALDGSKEYEIKMRVAYIAKRLK